MARRSRLSEYEAGFTRLHGLGEVGEELVLSSTPRPEGQALIETSYDQLVLQNRLLSIVAMSAATLAAGRYETNVVGANFPAAPSNDYIQLIRNSFPHPVAVQVSAIFTGGPGVHVRLSLGTDAATSLIVDYLGNAASYPSFGKLISKTIILVPNQALNIACWQSAVFPVQAADEFKVLMFDPMLYVSDKVWQTRK